MGRELGRISGPLLADNLKRNGTNLAFESRLLYLNVTGTRIGVNTLAPAYELDVDNSFRTTNINVAVQASLANLELYTNNIQNVIGNIVISPNQASNPTIVVPQLQASNLFFSGNTLSNTVTDADINVSLAVGSTTAEIKLNNNTLVSADLHATGDITWDGNITLGDNQAQDTVIFGSQINSDIIPDAITYDLGNNTTPLKWATVYVNTTAATVTGIVDVTTTNLTGSGTNLLNGNVVIGTAGSNTLAVTARINTSLIPSITDTYTLGSATGPKYWNNVYGVVFNNSNITVTANTIQTNTANSSLRLVANGIGQVVFSKLAVTNNATVGGTLAVTGTSTLTNTTAGVITQTGDYNLTGDTSITGNLSSVNITQLDDGSGGVGTTNFLLEDNTDFLQEDNTNLLFLETIGSSLFFQLPAVTIISSNINGTLVNTDLQITANGSGKILIPTDDVQFDQNLSVGQALAVTGTSTLITTSAGTIALAGDYNQTGNFVTTGTINSGSITATNPLVLPNVTIDGSVITGTVTDTPLTLTPYTGKVVQITGSALVDQNLTVGQTLSVVDTASLTNTTAGAITLTGNYDQTGNFVTTGTISSGDITAANPLVLPGLTFNSSTITGTLAGSDLVLTPKAGQQVKVTSSAKVTGDLAVGQTLTVGNTSTLTNTTTGVITLAGNYNQTGNFVTTGTIDSGSITAANPLTLPNITINGSTITGTVADTNLTLTPKVGFAVDLAGSVGTTTRVNQNLTVGGTFSVFAGSTLTNTTAGAITLAGDYNQTGNFVTTGTISSSDITAANPLTLPNVTINGSVITGTVANTALTLTPYSGQVVDITSNARIDNNLTVTGTLGVTNTSTLTNTTAGAITLAGDYNQTGNFVTTGTISSASITAANPLTLSTLTLDGSVITGTANSNLTLTANTGQLVKITSSAKVNNNLDVVGTFTIGGTSTLTNTTAGAITLAGNYNQTGNFVSTGAITSGSITSSGPFVTPSLIISGTPGNPITASSSIVGVNTNTNLVFTPYTGKIVEITSATKVNQNLRVYGDLSIAGLTTLDDNITTGPITLAGDYNQTGNFVTTGTISSSSITATNPLVLPSVTINGTTLTGTNTNSDLTFTAKASQQVRITSNATLDQNLTVSGTLDVTGTSTLTNTAAGAIAQTGDYNLTGDAGITGNVSGVNIALIDNGSNVADFLLEDGTDLLQEDNVSLLSLESSLLSSAYLQLPNVTISGSTVAGTAVNTDLRFTANGTGKILIPSDDVRIEQNLTVNGTFTETNAVNFVNPVVGSVTQTGDYNLTGSGSITGNVSSGDITAVGSGTILDIGNFRISGQTITSKVTDGSITLLGNGTGSVWLDGYLKISGNRLINNWVNFSEPYSSEDLQIFVSEDNITLYTEFGAPTELQSSINLTPTGTGNVVVSSDKSIKLPSANDSNALLTGNGSIRFNNVNNNIEGFKNTGYVSFINLYSQNYATYVTPELTPNADDNLLRFGINGVVKATISDSTVFSNTLHAGNVSISGSTISNLVGSNNLILAPNGTGSVKANNISFKSNQITNNTNNPLIFSSTGAGYAKVTGSTGIIVPQGRNDQRASVPELGETRYSTTSNYLEIFDGTNWVSASGSSASATLDEIQAELDLWSLVLG
jgi:hypothetical protein